MRRTICCWAVVYLTWTATAFGQGEPEVIDRIVQEGKDNSHVWEYLTYLCQEVGPRLTGSTSMMEANTWTRDMFVSFGLNDTYLQKVGEIPVRFDRGPSRAGMVEPIVRPFEFTSPAWSAGTHGPLAAQVVKMPTSLEEFDAIKDDLSGKWVLTKELSGRRWGPPGDDEDRAARELQREIQEKVRQAGIAGLIVGVGSEIVQTDGRNDWNELDYQDLPPDVTVKVRRSDYDVMNSRLADGERVVAEIELRHHFAEGPFPMFNTIAEIPGTEWPEQAVIISGHMDSWDGPGTQGAQDNGTGVVVALEAARILTAAGVKPRRTIRFILWTGEEQGFVGSRGYLATLTDEDIAGITAVFVDDGGTNYQGSLTCTEDMAEILTAATAPVGEAFPDMPVEIRTTERLRAGGSDHAPFIRAGVPGFYWGEHGSGGAEGKNYMFIWHSQNDILRYAIEDYLVQSATCSAITAYNLAMADELLPRVPRDERARPVWKPLDDESWKVIEGPLSGVWQGRTGGDDRPEGPGFSIRMEMAEDGRIRGMIDSRIGGGWLRRISFVPETGQIRFFTFTEYVGRIKFEATVTGDEMKGTISGEEGFSMPFTATRTETDPAAGVELTEEVLQAPDAEADDDGQ